jgi:demethylmenaquinone methyltransferase / 2-methoxy-6-polyprenyl-1,4-benzoquinol methylase
VPTELLDKREVRIQRMFKEIAPWYDVLNHVFSLNVDRRWRNYTARRVPPGPPESGPILDVCTGTGDLALIYDRAARGTVPIVGVDFCGAMLTRAARKAAASGAGERIRFVEADAQALPFPDNTFQIATIAFGLRNVTDTDRGIAEMVRVLRPGGRIAILEFSKPRHWLFGRLYRGYIRYALPLIGQLLCRSSESAYRYLPESLLRFPDYEALSAKLSAHGLVDVTYEPLTLGIATLYLGVKPAAKPTPGER